jgi:hypothetical protein
MRWGFPVAVDSVELEDVDQLPVETTLYSLSNKAPAPPNRREDQRHLTLFRVGTMVVEGVRELCLIKNISAGGLMLRAYRQLDIGQKLQVELKTGEPLSGVVSWVRDQQIGLAFDEHIDVIAILSSSMEGQRPRMPRIETNSFVQVRQGASLYRGRACDISQGGVKIETSKAFAPASEVVVLLPGLAPQPAVVRWSGAGFAGMTFNRLLPLPMLIEWLQSQREDARAA